MPGGGTNLSIGQTSTKEHELRKEGKSDAEKLPCFTPSGHEVAAAMILAAESEHCVVKGCPSRVSCQKGSEVGSKGLLLKEMLV